MDNLSKDEMQFMNQGGNMDAIRTSMGDNEMFGSMLLNNAINSSDAKTKTEAEKALAQQIASGKLDVGQLGITGESISKMRGETAQAIENGYVELWKRAQPGISDSAARNGARNYIRANVSTQINNLRNDSQALSRTNNTTSNIFGV